MLGWKRQKVDDRLDYDLDFSRWLDGDDTLTDVTAEADNLTVDQVQLFGTVVKVWLSGGTVGQTAKVEVVATSANGRVKEESFLVRVSDC